MNPRGVAGVAIYVQQGLSLPNHSGVTEHARFVFIIYQDTLSAVSSVPNGNVLGRYNEYMKV